MKPEQNHEGKGGQPSVEEIFTEADLTLAGPSQATPSQAGPSTATLNKALPSHAGPKMTDSSSESEVKEIVPSANGSRRRQFHEDVCFAFMACDIPLNNVNKEPMKNLFKKYSGKSLPDQ